MAQKREINIAENWERAYDAFQQINFKAWDYNSIKESLLDYMKLYYPEDFNDYIESSDLIAIIELFAYIAELLAYRIDLNSHENFLSTAERKESVLRLAKYISYNASRNLTPRGMVKITSIRTTERVVDSNGKDLSNKAIRWNDPDNPDWKEHFMLVMNKVLQQQFGTVLPTDRIQVQDVLFELYTLRNAPLASNVLSYNISVADNTFPMELISSELSNFGPKEKRPEHNQQLNILYLRDGLGDSSDNTGFFFFTKQGTLKRQRLEFDGVLPNQSISIDDNNINHTDIWLNNIDPETQEILTGDELFGEPRRGEWEQVDIANTQNILFNTAPNRNKYEVETLDDDRARLLFGDGNFSNIPNGVFEVWYRISDDNFIDDPTIIPKSAIQNKSSSFRYTGEDGRPYTFSFTFSLFSPIQNAAPTESIEHIRNIAPSVYYTQDRMVNSRDYNEFMLKDNSILKLRSINRTFAGDSKYIAWHDPKAYYENVKLFGDDMKLYYRTSFIESTALSSDLPSTDGGLSVSLVSTLIDNHIQPVLKEQKLFNTLILEGLAPGRYSDDFSTNERNNLTSSLTNLVISGPNTIYLTYDIDESDQNNNVWVVTLASEPPEWHISVEVQANDSWVITYRSTELVAHSDEVDFVVNNDNTKVLTVDTLNAQRDEIVILKANIGSDGCALDRNYGFSILSGDTVNVGSNTGLCNYNAVITMPKGITLSGIPSVIDLDYLIPEDSFVYLHRPDENSPWQFVEYSSAIDQLIEDEPELWKKQRGIENVNFLWMHRTPRFHLVDPAASNIIDTFIITRGYYSNLKLWLNRFIDNEPKKPTPFQLRSDYGYLIDSKMISDTVILHPGDVKIIIGNKAPETLRAVLKVVKAETSSMSDNRIKNEIVSLINEYFDINRWNFGQPFFFTDLASIIHNRLRSEINSVVLVPRSSSHAFGSLFQVIAKESEIIQPDINSDDVDIVQSLDPDTLKQRL